MGACKAIGAFPRATVLVVGFIVVLPLGLADCGTRALSREEAQKLIAESDPFKDPITTQFNLGQVNPKRRRQSAIHGLLENLSQSAHLENATEWRAVDCLVEWGYVAYGPGEEVILTDKGSAAEKNWLRNSKFPKLRIVPIGFRNVLKITGLTGGQVSDEMVAEFEWEQRADYDGQRFGAVNMQGPDGGIRCLIPLPNVKGHRSSSGGTYHKGRAVFKMYDDGWRLTDISLDE